VYLVGWKRFGRPGSSKKIVKHSVETPSEEVLKHWTAEKMRDAKVTNMPTVDGPDQRKQDPGRPRI
jgi:hypothetical protein